MAHLQLLFLLLLGIELCHAEGRYLGDWCNDENPCDEGHCVPSGPMGYHCCCNQTADCNMPCESCDSGECLPKSSQMASDDYCEPLDCSLFFSGWGMDGDAAVCFRMGSNSGFCDGSSRDCSTEVNPTNCMIAYDGTMSGAPILRCPDERCTEYDHCQEGELVPSLPDMTDICSMNEKPELSAKGCPPVQCDGNGEARDAVAYGWNGKDCLHIGTISLGFCNAEHTCAPNGTEACVAIASTFQTAPTANVLFSCVSEECVNSMACQLGDTGIVSSTAVCFSNGEPCGLNRMCGMDGECLEGIGGNCTSWEDCESNNCDATYGVCHASNCGNVAPNGECLTCTGNHWGPTCEDYCACDTCDIETGECATCTEANTCGVFCTLEVDECPSQGCGNQDWCCGENRTAQNGVCVCDSSHWGTSCEKACSDACPHNKCNNVTGACESVLSLGYRCELDEQCEGSYHCVEGVCCNTICNQSCQSCFFDLTGSAQGTCDYVKRGRNPSACGVCEWCDGMNSICLTMPWGYKHPDCPQNDPCGAPGTCDSTGQCMNTTVRSGDRCGLPECNGNQFTDWSICDDMGNCVVPTPIPCVGGLQCMYKGFSCMALCDSSYDCIDGHFCDEMNHTCVPELADGKPCTEPAHCANNVCAPGGVCCDSPCEEACDTCLGDGYNSFPAGKCDAVDPVNDDAHARCPFCHECTTSGGVCQPAAYMTDPRQECVADEYDVCGRLGGCNGLGECIYADNMTECSNRSCIDDGVLIPTRYCTGKGWCEHPRYENCPGHATCGTAPQTCLSLICWTNAQCQYGFMCDMNTNLCVPTFSNGHPCNFSSECVNFCSNGYCCEQNCSTCQTCKSGTCENVPWGEDPLGNCGSCYTCSGSGGCMVAPKYTDPHNDCIPYESQGGMCGQSGYCDGNGNCAKSTGEPCWPAYCSGNDLAKYIVCISLSCQDLGNSIGCGSGCGYYDQVAYCIGETCITHANCLVGRMCNFTSGYCVQKFANGMYCEEDAQCLDGTCVINRYHPHGVCFAMMNCSGDCYIPDDDGTNCVTVPNGSPVPVSGHDCEMCTGLGQITNVTFGRDPGNHCEENMTNVCGTTGYCDGNGGCALHQANSVCGESRCVVEPNGITREYPAPMCDGSGHCVEGGTGGTICNDNLGCTPDGRKCKTMCTGDGDCRNEKHYCDHGFSKCYLKQSGGYSCSTTEECVPGFVCSVDGVCCDSYCNNSCMHCGGTGGHCTPMEHGNYPHPNYGAGCPLCTYCDGMGGCTALPWTMNSQGKCPIGDQCFGYTGYCYNGYCELRDGLTSPCGLPSCSNSLYSMGGVCSGGSCVYSPSILCPGNYSCIGGICGNNCLEQDQNGCASGYYCGIVNIIDRVCLPKKELGDKCLDYYECQNGVCSDGVCCSTSDCDESCESCAGLSPGYCTSVLDFTDPRGDCAQQEKTCISGSCSDMAIPHCAVEDLSTGACMKCYSGWWGNSSVSSFNMGEPTMTCSKSCHTECWSDCDMHTGHCDKCDFAYGRPGDPCGDGCDQVIDHCGICTEDGVAPHRSCCNDHGTMPGEGSCMCDHVGWNNTDNCGSCVGNMWGPDCTWSCSTTCGAPGYCNDGTGMCLTGCVPGFEVPDCDDCVEGNWASDCQSICGDHCVNIACNRTTGFCNEGCASGYWGWDCESDCASCATCDQASGNCSSCPNGTYNDVGFCDATCSIGCVDQECNGYTGVCTCVDASTPQLGGWCGSKCDLIYDNCTDCDEESRSCCSNGQGWADENGKCHCDPMYYDSLCDMMCEYCTTGCNATGACTSGCSENQKYGPFCNLECGLGCVGGVCDFTDGDCACLSTNWFPTSGPAGPACSTCADGYWGIDCSVACPEGCADGLCTVDKGTCYLCNSSDLYGETCESVCTPLCVDCDADIAGIGTCTSCLHGAWGGKCSATCPAVPDFVPLTLCECHQSTGVCLSCPSGRYGSACAGECGWCLNENRTCEFGNGECSDDCRIEATGYDGAPCGPGCTLFKDACGSCDGDGRSCCTFLGTKDFGTGVCMCDDEWWGDVCNKPCPPECNNTAVTCNMGDGACGACPNNITWGVLCEIPCSAHCVENKCDSLDGTCSCQNDGSTMWTECGPRCTQTLDVCLVCNGTDACMGLFVDSFSGPYSGDADVSVSFSGSFYNVSWEPVLSADMKLSCRWRSGPYVMDGPVTIVPGIPNDVLTCFLPTMDLEVVDGVYGSKVDVTVLSPTKWELPSAIGWETITIFTQTHPHIDVISPSVLEALVNTGEQKVIVIGSGFVDDELLCQFGDVAYQTVGSYLSDSVIQCPVPNHPVSTSTTLTISNNNGINWGSIGGDVRFFSAPKALAFTQQPGSVTVNAGPLIPSPSIVLWDVHGSETVAESATLVVAIVEPEPDAVWGDLVTIQSDVSRANFTEFGFAGRQDVTYHVRFSVTDLADCVSNAIVVGDCDDVLLHSMVNSTTGVCECPRGKFFTGDECSLCPSAYWKDWLGNDECVPCEETTYTEGREGASDIADCVCIIGYYENLENKDAYECLLCPEGAQCDGGDAQPQAAPGFYAREGVSGDTLFIECQNKSRCLGGANSSCVTGYTGTLCASCNAGYFPLGGECNKCSAGSELLIVLFLFFVILGMALLYMYSFDRQENPHGGALRCGLNMLQVAALFGEFKLNWPSSVMVVYDSLSFVNLNVAISAPECSLGTITFLDKWMLKMLLAPALVLTLILIYGLLRSMSSCLDSRENLHHQVRESFSVKSRNALWRSFLVLVLTLYLPMASAAISFFDCTRLDDGTMLLDGDPDVVCYEGHHKELLGGAIVCMILYVVVTPMSLVWIVRQRWKKADTEDERQRAVGSVGVFFANYSDKYWYWEMMILGRKLALSVIIVMISNYPTIQVLFAVSTLILALVAHRGSNPYNNTKLNTLETYSLLVCALVLLFGIVFHNGDIDGRTELAMTFFIGFLLIGGFVAFLVLIYVQVRAVKDERERRRSIRVERIASIRSKRSERASTTMQSGVEEEMVTFDSLRLTGDGLQKI